VATSLLEIHSASRLESQTSQRLFFCSLALATALPLIWLGFGVELFHENKAWITAALLPVIAMTGVGHVGATAFLYFDREFSELIKQNRQRFFVWPMLAAAGCLALFSASDTVWTIILMGFLSWQLYHYHRQNYGIIAFAAQSVGCRKLPAELNWMLNLGVTAATLRGAFASPVIYDLSIVLYVFSTVMLFKILRALTNARENPLLLVFTILAWAFFLPRLITTDPLVGFWSYAIAHGAQYLIFMIVISGNCKRSIIGLSVLVLVFASVFVLFSQLNTSEPGVAIYTGLVMGHFLIDAKVWRLREPLQRNLIQARFAFIFN
jgi:hypothetical protein